MTAKTAATPQAAPEPEAVDGADPIDIYVGQRLKARRDHIGVTQQNLSAMLGLTHQQVGKYEKATNRISASMLYKLAKRLRVPVGYFYEGLPATAREGAPEKLVEPMYVEFWAQPGAKDLVKTFLAMTPPARRNLIDMAKASAAITKAAAPQAAEAS